MSGAPQDRTIRAADSTVSQPKLPARVGDCQIVGLLGAGGMGVVYEASQQTPHRRVAVKVLRPELLDSAFRRRFETEVEVLGWLNHPCIAQVYSSGTQRIGGADCPYFVMELVEGERLDRWVASRRPSRAERLALLREVCSAVHHAHQKGVIHRDLKPANILVDAQARPKILDFGVARIADRELTRDTTAGRLVGTLAYMSPEQLAADPSEIDTRTDVYALGVLAYELLGGRRPFALEDVELHEAARVVAEDEPPLLGRLETGLRGDVESVVAKAMEKDKTRRYGSADELASDIGRFLDHEPVLARPQTWSYRLRKFSRRNRSLVLGFVGLCTALLAATTVSSAFYLRYREEQAANEVRVRAFQAQVEQNRTLSDQYEREAAVANQAVALLEDVFQNSDPIGTEEELSARDLIDTSAERIRATEELDPRVRGRLMSLLGKAYNGMGMQAEAEPVLLEAQELLRQSGRTDSLEYADVLERLAHAGQWTGDFERSEALQREALAIRKAELGPEDPSVAQAYNNLGNALASRFALEEAVVAYDEALRIELTAAQGDRARVNDFTLFNRAGIAVDLGDFDTAETGFQELLERPLDDGVRTMVLMKLGVMRKMQRRFDEAEVYLSDAYLLAREVFQPASSNLLQIRSWLASTLTDLGRPREALPLMEENFAFIQELYGERSTAAGSAAHDLAYVLHDVPEAEEAERWYLFAIEIWGEQADLDQSRWMALHNLGVLYSDTGRFEEAEAVTREAFSGRRESLGLEHPNTRASRDSLGTILRKMGRGAEADAL